MQIGLKNLRRLQNIGPIDLRPLTILVGRNSSGKSTFLRSFPLLRQSVTTRTSSPILWFGDLVDFGDFENAVSHESSEEMSFSFKLENVVTEQNISFAVEGYIDQQTGDENEGTLDITIGKDGSGTRIVSFELLDSQNNAVYSAKVGKQNIISSLTIDNNEMMAYFKSVDIRVSPGALLPSLVFSTPTPNITSAIVRPFNSPILISLVQTQICQIMKPFLDKRTTQDTLNRLVSTFLPMPVVSKDAISESALGQSNLSWRKLIKDISSGKKDEVFNKIRNLLLLIRFSTLLRGFYSSVNETLSSVLYIGPARAKSDRYYRYQDLNVSEIDPDGKNFAMFLNSLRPADLNAFSGWVKQLFGYGVKVSRASGHISIELEYETGPVNIIDTGYGISQILPVLGQIWWANARPSVRRYSGRGRKSLQIIAIEQPELHLHPAHQSLLADAFVGALRQRSGSSLTLVIETHSEIMINRIGGLIATGTLQPNEVQIVLFEDSDENKDAASVSTVNFNEEGELLNWPYGFFLPS